MKKILMLIAAVIVMAAPAFAQSAFSDVPRDHWAYGAVSQLEKAGLIVGYPDGTFKGKRTLTRYEYAMIIARLLPFLNDEDINVNAFATKKDLDGYAKLSDIKGADLSGVASKADLDTIAKLANEFKAELTALGVDINSLNADVNALRSRVAAIEDEQARVVINGDLNIVGKYDFKKDNAIAYDRDRRPFKEGSQGTELAKDFQINVKGRVNNNINAYLTLVAGDYMKKRMEGVADWKTDISASVDSTVIPYYMYATMDMGKWGDAKVGRMPMQLNKYVYKKFDVDSYADIARMDNGDYQVGGVDYTKDFGVVDVRAWFTQPESSIYFDQTLFGLGDYYETGYKAYGLQTPVKTMTGAQLGFNISGARVEALINYNEAFKSYEGCTSVNATGLKNSKIYGGTVAIPFGSFAFDGAYFQQKTSNMNKYYTKLDNKAHLAAADVTFNWNGLTVKGGYKDVKAGYAAPADYEAMAYIHNPNNIKGFNAFVGYVNGNFDVYGTYKQYKNKSKNANGNYDFIGQANDKIKYWNAGLGYNFGNWGKVGAEYEQLNNHGAKANYLTVSWLKKIGNANFKLAYQNVNNKDLNNKANFIYGQAGYTF